MLEIKKYIIDKNKNKLNIYCKIKYLKDNMRKNRIRLTESQLHGIIRESVNRVLREAAYDMNSPEYKQMYDSGNKWYDGREDADTRKEIEDYEALPDKVRHPFGTEIPDLSDRIKNRPWKSNDKLAKKSPNSILKKQQEKYEFQKDLERSKHNYPFRMWCRKNGLSMENLTDHDLVNLYRDYIEERFEEQERWNEIEDYLG